MTPSPNPAPEPAPEKSATPICDEHGFIQYQHEKDTVGVGFICLKIARNIELDASHARGELEKVEALIESARDWMRWEESSLPNLAKAYEEIANSRAISEKAHFALTLARAEADDLREKLKDMEEAFEEERLLRVKDSADLAQARDTIKALREALEAAKLWHHGSAWRFSKDPVARLSWQRHMDKLNAALASTQEDAP